MRIILLLPDPSGVEERAVHTWLHAQSGPRAGVHPLTAFRGAECDILWVHAGGLVVPAASTLEMLNAQKPKAGFLFSGGAALLPHQLGWDPAPYVTARTWRDADDELFFHDTVPDAPRIRGHAGFRSHPLLTAMHGGVYTWAPVEGERYACVRYRLPHWPERARVIATERAYIGVAHEYATIWEYDDNQGPRALCIGAHFPFAPTNARFRRHQEQLARAALRHLELKPKQPGSSWPLPGTRAQHDAKLAVPHLAGSRPAPIAIAHPELRIAGGNGADPFTLAGRRALALGTERGGVHEVWVHPLRALQHLEVADARPVATQVSPLGIERTFAVGSVTVEERTTVPLELGAVVIEWTAAAPVTLELSWQCDLRFAWPYPAGMLGDLRWHHDAHALIVRAATDRDIVCCHFGGAVVDWKVESATGTARVAVHARLPLEAGQPARLIIAAAASGHDELTTTLTALHDPASLTNARAALLRRQREERLSVDTPEPELGRGVEWAKHRLDSYLVSTPGVGRSLVAGYAATRPGWNDGRPGYGWYFGRDAVWTALAALAVGDFAAARDVVRFLGEKQDISGKILHECSTSGLLHYDAADATPLYLLLVARCHAWTGETAFVANEWERVKRALQFCISTDPEQHGLIENTGVGHGWIEAGPLAGGRITYYNAGVWAAALRELERTALDIGDRSLSSDLHARAQQAAAAIETRFHDDERGTYALKAWTEDGEWRTDPTPTATHAVPLLLGVVDGERAGSWLDAVASDDFTTPWGVRMIAASHPLFDPKSYHTGSVWPLYTGWVSWAEYAAGRERSAWVHLRSNLRLMHERAKGAWDEVLHGTTGEAVGGCPDQAWSAAMLLAPLIYGMLGAEPDAFRSRLRLRPQLPDAWSRCEFRNLRIGEAAVTLRYERNGARVTFRAEQEQGATPITLLLEPLVSAPELRSARVDGRPAELAPRPLGERLLVPVQLVLDAERVLELELAGD